jgi:hypothetical protein
MYPHQIAQVLKFHHQIPPNYKSTSLHDKVEAFNIERMKQLECNLFPSNLFLKLKGTPGKQQTLPSK